VILSDRTIKLMMKKGLIKIDPEPTDEALQPASIDLHLAGDFLTFPWIRDSIDPECPPEMDRETFSEPRLLLGGEFILGSTVERISLADGIVARLDGKSSLGRLGLAVHSTAGFIDPGFKGNITLELKNLNRYPILLHKGMAIGQICFMRTSTVCLRPYGSKGLGSKYQDSEGVVGPKGTDK
jgi:dCTP deaminase